MLGENVKEIAIKNRNWKQAATIIETLVENDYIVMTTLEENLIIINYTYGSECRSDRNLAVFMGDDDYWDMIDKQNKEQEDD